VLGVVTFLERLSPESKCYRVVKLGLKGRNTSAQAEANAEACVKGQTNSLSPEGAKEKLTTSSSPTTIGVET